VSDPYIGEIKIWAFNWAPTGWALCNGALLPVNQNAALNSLLGQTYGGNGSTTFALPDLRGRTPVGYSATALPDRPNYAMGAAGGAEGVTLTAASVPPHAHQVVAYTGNGAAPLPTGNNLASVVPSTAGNLTNFSTFQPPANWAAQAQLNAGTIASAGGSQPHQNMQPYTVMNFTICTVGNYPPRN